MKRNYTASIFWFIVTCFLAFSCKEKRSVTTVTSHEHAETSYTCPMHPQVISDKPGNCPICGMPLVPMNNMNELPVDSSLLPLLKPVNEQVVSSMPSISPEDATRIFSVPIQGVVTYDTRNQASVASRVAGRIEKMYIRYNYQQVSKGQLIMEIYSADLAAAQRELIYISRNDNNPSLLQKAKQRLSLLGMTAGQIENVLRTGRPIYKVPVYSTVSGYIIERDAASPMQNTGTSTTASSQAGPGDGMGGMGGGGATTSPTVQQPTFSQTPVVAREGQYVSAGETIFTIYRANAMVAEFSFDPSLAAEINRGQKLVFHTASSPDDIKTGTIGLIQPVQRSGGNFTIARVYLSGSNLQPGQLLTANIPVVKKGVYWLPAEAVLQLGSKSIVFKKESTVYVPKEIKTGIRINGLVEVTADISDWQVAKNASFLVDSESFIKVTSNNALK